MSSTQTVTVSSYPTLILTLKNKPPPDEHNEDKKKKITWDPKVVDNEFMNKRKMNCCPNCNHKRKNLFVPK